MEFYTYGNPNNKAIILIHTLFTSADFFAPITQMLSESFFVITPTLSGHHTNSTYRSTDDELRQIKDFLTERGITSVYAVAGFSLGGNIAYNFYCQNSNMIEKAIIDSAPLFRFPSFVKRRFYKSYEKCLRKIKQEDCDIPKELNKCFNGMGEYQKNVAPTVSFDSLKNLVESCYNNKMYKLTKQDKNKISFVYGTKDISRLCKYRLKGYKIRKFKGLGHCGLYRKTPVEWAKEFLLS